MGPNHVEVIRPACRFTLESRHQFSKSFKTALQHPVIREIQINLEHVEYMDSSAFAMVLMARERALVDGKTVSLASPQPKISALLEMAGFPKLFNIL